MEEQVYSYLITKHVGKENLISLVADRLTGIGKEIGPSMNQNTNFLKDYFLHLGLLQVL